MGFKKLSAAEVSEVTAKIRSKYDFYCKTYFKPSRLKQDFENRYRDALKKGYDISSFLLAEISVIDELLQKAEEKIAQNKPETDKPPMDFADKIIRDNQQKIEKYPKLNLHKDASEEIKHLSGALNHVYEVMIPDFNSLLRQIELTQDIRSIETYEARLRPLAYTGKGMIPAQLTRYYAHLNKFPRDYKSIDWEEKQYILESSFLLHDIYNTLSHIVDNVPKMTNQIREKLRVSLEYISGMIDDFRLKDLKKSL